MRKQLIEAKIFLTYRRDLNNLSIQEARLRRQREKDLARPKEMRHERAQKLLTATRLYKKAQREGKPFDPAEMDEAALSQRAEASKKAFDFTIEEIQEHIIRAEALYRPSRVA